MIKHYFQVLVLFGVCMAWGQGITEVIDQSGKDSAVAISDTSVVSNGAISKKVTAVITTAKDTTAAIVIKDTTAAIVIKDTTAAIAIKDTTAAIAIKDTTAAIAIKDTTAAIAIKDTTAAIGDNSKPDSAQEASNIIVVDTSKTKVSEPVLTVAEAIPEKKEENHQTFGGRSGIGINLMTKVFNSKELNTFFEDVYDQWIDDVPGTIKSKSEFSPMVSMMGVNLKGVIYVGPVVGLEPFGFVSLGKSMYIVRDHDHEVDINLVDVAGGVNVWARLAPKKRVSFKAGLGGYVSYSTLDVDSYAGEVQFTGVGYGVNILAGIDITLRKLAVNIDFLLPVGSTELNQHSIFNQIGSSRTIRYPSKYVHTGFVIRPGVTFQF